MSIHLDQIQHHQRILFTGSRTSDIMDAALKVMNHYGRQVDIIRSGEEKIGNGPVVFIESKSPETDYAPHIAIIDEVKSDQIGSFTKLADSIPKAGTLVYNLADKNVKAICDPKRDDVYQESYQGSVQAAAKSLLKRIGIHEEMFNAAQPT